MGRSGGWVEKVEGEREELEQRYMWKYRHIDCIIGIHTHRLPESQRDGLMLDGKYALNTRNTING